MRALRQYRLGREYRDLGRANDSNDQFLGWINLNGRGMRNQGGIRTLGFRRIKAPVHAAIVLVTHEASMGTDRNPWDDVVDVEHRRIVYWGDAKRHEFKTALDWVGNRALTRAFTQVQAGDGALIPPVLHFSRHATHVVRFNGLCVIDELEPAAYRHRDQVIRNVRARLSILDEDTVEVGWLHSRMEASTIGELIGVGPSAWVDYQASLGGISRGGADEPGAPLSSHAVVAQIGKPSPRDTVGVAALSVIGSHKQVNEQPTPSTFEDVDLTQLEPVSIPVDRLYLDPNNPRLVDKAASDERVPDAAIASDEWQSWCEQQLASEGYDDIIQKVQKWGFLPVDRIVVRPIANDEDKYVVLEGNRRLAALRKIRSSPPLKLRMSEPAKASLEAPQVLVYNGQDEEISWLLQGFRHIESIKGWGTFQQARFLVELRDKRGLKPGALAAQAGLDARKVAKLLRSHAGWHQAQKDDEYGKSVVEQDFAVFNEAIFQTRSSALATWLGWDEQTAMFANADNLRLLLGLLKDKSEDTGKPRIERVNPDLRDHFQVLLQPEHSALLSQFLDGTKDLGQAYRDAERNEGREKGQEALTDLPDQMTRLAELRLRVETLPWTRVSESELSAQFIEVLEQIAATASKQVALLREQDEGDADGPPAG